MFAPPVVIVYEYFEKYKSLASGLSMCGHSCASLAIIPLCRYLIDTLGWRGAMLIMAGVALHCCVGGMIFADNEERKDTDKNSLRDSLRCKGLHSVNFVLFVVAFSILWCLLNILLLLSPSRAVSKGLSVMEGSMLLPFIGFSSTVSRFIFSWVANMKCTNHLALFSACMFTMSAGIAASCIRPDNFIFSAAMLTFNGLMIGNSIFSF